MRKYEVNGYKALIYNRKKSNILVINDDIVECNHSTHQ
jgi:hypothetical protein